MNRGPREAACRTAGGRVEAASSGARGTAEEPRCPERVGQTSPGAGAARGAKMRRGKQLVIPGQSQAIERALGLVP